MQLEHKLDLSLSLLTQDSSNLEAEKQEQVVNIISKEMKKINQKRDEEIAQADKKLEVGLKKNIAERNRSFPEFLSAAAALFFFGLIAFAVIRNYWNPLHITLPIFFAITGSLVALGCICICVVAACRKTKMKIEHNIELQDIHEHDVEKQQLLSKAYVPSPVVISQKTSSKTTKNEAAQSLLKNVDFQDTDVSNNKFMFDGYRNGTTSIEPKISNTPNSQQHQEEESLIKFEN